MIKRYKFCKALVIGVLGAMPLLSYGGEFIAETSLAFNYQMVAAAPQDKTMMSPDEMQFANQLSGLHRQIFMTVFTPALRQEAMSIMTMPGNDMEGGAPMSADMAVEEVISNHRDMPASDNNGQQPSTTAPSNPTKDSGSSKKTNYWSS